MSGILHCEKQIKIYEQNTQRLRGIKSCSFSGKTLTFEHQKLLLAKFESWLHKVVSDCRILDLFIAVVSLYNYNSTSLFIRQFTCRNEPIILGFFFSLTSWGSNKPIKVPLLSMIFLSDTTENKLNLKS